MKIIIDSREKTGAWTFPEYETEIVGLNTGDYTIAGFEDELCIERKKTTAEFMSNITTKRFENEIWRMHEFEHKFLILEFSLEDLMMFPVGSGIPKYRWKKLKVNVPFALSFLAKIQIKQNISVIFGGNRQYSQTIALNIMKEVYR